MSMSVLAPGILIAAPPLEDPHFDRSVVLLASQDEQGAFGWVINGDNVLSVGELLEQSDLEAKGLDDSEILDVQVSRGGPVSTQQVWLVYPSSYEIPGVEPQMEVAPGISATASREFLEHIAGGAEVPVLRAFAGYAGWGAGQLEEEIKQGAWLPSEVSAEILFQTDPSQAWSHAYEMLGVTPLAFTSHIIGSA